MSLLDRQDRSALLRLIWPPERVVLGLQVCRWMKCELLHCVDRVSLVAWTGNIGAEDLAKSMHRFQGNRIILKVPRCCTNLLEWMMESGHLFGEALQEVDLRCELKCGETVNLSTVFERYERLTHLRLVHVGMAALKVALESCTPRISHLDISLNKVSGEQMLSISNQLAGFQNLVHLDVSHNRFDAAALPNLAHILQNCRLKHLNLDAIGLEPEGMAMVAQPLGTCTGLTHLNLARNRIQAAGARCLAGALLRMPRLRLLDLFGNDVTVSTDDASGQQEYGPASERLWDAIKASASLTHLDLSRNSLWRAAAAPHGRFGDALRACSALTRLDMHNNARQPRWQMHDALWQVLADGLSGCGALRLLNVRQNAMGPGGALWLGEGLQRLTSLTTLDVSENTVQSAGMLQVAAGLRGSSTLTSLSVAMSGAGPGVWFAVAGELAGCSGLRRLSLRDNRIAGDADALAALLSAVPGLTVLDLASTILKREALVPVLRGRGALSRLDLSWNLLKDAGATELARALPGCPRVCCLVLSKNEIGPPGATALAEGLRGCAGLRRLSLHANAVGAEGAAALGSCLAAATHLSLAENQIGGTGQEERVREALEALAGTARQLTDLDLGQNLLTAGDVAAFARGMRGGAWRMLRRVVLGGSRIAEADREQLAEEGVMAAIQAHCVALRHLDVGQPPGHGLWAGRENGPGWLHAVD